MTSLLPLLLAAALTIPVVARGDSLRCDGGIVSVGDSKLDLIGKCGQPALREAQAEERSRVQLDAAGRAFGGQASVVTLERWTYNFGTRSFVQHVTLEGGRIVAVERGGYGYDLGAVRSEGPGIPRARCDQLAFHVGDSTFDVLARCGEPALRDARLVTRVLGAGAGRGGTFDGASVTELVEVWTYDLGPQTLVRSLLIAGGKVVAVETGGYGYSRLEDR
jgi:hypothetical protein